MRIDYHNNMPFHVIWEDEYTRVIDNKIDTSIILLIINPINFPIKAFKIFMEKYFTNKGLRMICLTNSVCNTAYGTIPDNVIDYIVNQCKDKNVKCITASIGALMSLFLGSKIHYSQCILFNPRIISDYMHHYFPIVLSDKIKLNKSWVDSKTEYHLFYSKNSLYDEKHINMAKHILKPKEYAYIVNADDSHEENTRIDIIHNTAKYLQDQGVLHNIVDKILGFNN